MHMAMHLVNRYRFSSLTTMCKQLLAYFMHIYRLYKRASRRIDADSWMFTQSMDYPAQSSDRYFAKPSMDCMRIS